MAFIKFNKKETEKKANSFGEIPDGDYELLVTKAEWRPMLDKPDKTPYFNLELTVRTDVDQECGGRKIFHSFFVSRDPEKVENSMDFINRFNLAIGMPDEVEIETQEQWCDFILGKAVKAKVKNEKSEYNGKTYENVRIKYFSETEHEEITHEMDKPSGIQPVKDKKKAAAKPKQEKKLEDDPFANDGETIDIDDDDLPF